MFVSLFLFLLCLMSTFVCLLVLSLSSSFLFSSPPFPSFCRNKSIHLFVQCNKILKICDQTPSTWWRTMWQPGTPTCEYRYDIINYCDNFQSFHYCVDNRVNESTIVWCNCVHPAWAFALILSVHFPSYNAARSVYMFGQLWIYCALLQFIISMYSASPILILHIWINAHTWKKHQIYFVYTRLKREMQVNTVSWKCLPKSSVVSQIIFYELWTSREWRGGGLRPWRYLRWKTTQTNTG